MAIWLSVLFIDKIIKNLQIKLHKLITFHIDPIWFFRYSLKFFHTSSEFQNQRHQRYSIKKGVLKNFAKFNFIKKETLALMFSCEFCESFKNTFFTELLWTTASEIHMKFI